MDTSKHRLGLGKLVYDGVDLGTQGVPIKFKLESQQVMTKSVEFGDQATKYFEFSNPMSFEASLAEITLQFIARILGLEIETSGANQFIELRMALGRELVGKELEMTFYNGNSPSLLPEDHIVIYEAIPETKIEMSAGTDQRLLPVVFKTLPSATNGHSLGYIGYK